MADITLPKSAPPLSTAPFNVEEIVQEVLRTERDCARSLRRPESPSQSLDRLLRDNKGDNVADYVVMGAILIALAIAAFYLLTMDPSSQIGSAIK